MGIVITNILTGCLRSSPRILVTLSRSMSKHSNPWVGIKVQDLEDQPHELAEEWENQRAVVFLVRRFG